MYFSVWDSITLWYVILDDQGLPWPLTQTEPLEPRMVNGALKMFNSWTKESSYQTRSQFCPYLLWTIPLRNSAFKVSMENILENHARLFCNDASLSKTWKLFFSCLLENTQNHWPFGSSFLIVVSSQGNEKKMFLSAFQGAGEYLKKQWHRLLAS